MGSNDEEEFAAAVDEIKSLTSRQAAGSSSPTSSRAHSPGHQGSASSHISSRDTNSYTATLSLDSDTDQYPASMTSSVRAHVYEGGLRYHAFRDGRYAFPNDEVEQNRDNMKHTVCLMLSRGKHFYSPVEEVLESQGEVLDLGTCFSTVQETLQRANGPTDVTLLDFGPIYALPDPPFR